MNDDRVQLSVPAVPAFARIARLTAASLASRVGFGYDDVEDVRIAVGEACAVLLGRSLADEHADEAAPGEPGPATPNHGGDGDGQGSGALLHLTVELIDDGLDIELRRTGDPVDRPVDELSLHILGAVVDEFSVTPAAGDGPAVRLVKRRSADAG